MADLLAIVTDLIFATRIRATAEAAGRSCTVVASLPALIAALEDSARDLAVVDMNLAGFSGGEAIRTIKARSAATRVVAFFSHVQTALAEQARDAGADDVWPRSRFVQELTGLVSRASL